MPGRDAARAPPSPVPPHPTKKRQRVARRLAGRVPSLALGFEAKLHYALVAMAGGPHASARPAGAWEQCPPQRLPGPVGNQQAAGHIHPAHMPEDGGSGALPCLLLVALLMRCDCDQPPPNVERGQPQRAAAATAATAAEPAFVLRPLHALCHCHPPTSPPSSAAFCWNI